ncbi:hypothetical protein [Bradyrhizobium sp.]|jgi:hypothetical protein|uniref:hypothetical protein n=1 Tax=Bradyrhizobium sp. TaxID=376 RepID=UPI0025BD26C5|nr:hypothetical protein [Bradyrhizobium sp.]MCA3567250.1 hypothetical protein [Bradyrhizobium sp.]MCA3575800.1 hypothetical protein [Bradyrhizobium sp.]
MTNRTPISEILSGDDLRHPAACAASLSTRDLRARVLAVIRPMPEETADGTTLGEARAIVAGWQRAHDLTYLSPEACLDLAERIEAAMIAERAEP